MLEDGRVDLLANNSSTLNWVTEYCVPEMIQMIQNPVLRAKQNPQSKIEKSSGNDDMVGIVIRMAMNRGSAEAVTVIM